MLTPFKTLRLSSQKQLLILAKVVESVLVINPGTLAKRRAAGTYARVIVQPAKVTDEERQRGVAVAHRLWERSRVDIVKI